MRPLSQTQLQWLALVGVDLTVPFTLIGIRRSGGVTVAVAALTSIVVLASLNGLLLFAIQRRNTSQSLPRSRGFVSGAVALAVLSGSVSIAAVALIPSHNSYLELALSNTPLESIQPAQKRLVVELIRKRAANSHDYDAQVAEARANPLSPALYTPESFASIEVMQATLSKLEWYITADMAYSDKQQLAMADFRAKMAQADPAYLRDWGAKRLDQEEIEAKTIASQRQWFNGVVALYNFSEEHAKAIKLNGKELGFSEPGLKSEFERQLSASKEAYDQYIALEKQLAQRQEEAQRATGFELP
jgi:hypothetical protein